jgi:hypothetical protein
LSRGAIRDCSGYPEARCESASQRQPHTATRPLTSQAGGDCRGLRFVLTGLYMFFSGTRARGDARSAYFLALSATGHAIVAFCTVEYAKHGPYYFRVLFKQRHDLKVAAITGSMVLDMGLAYLFKRLVSHRAVRASAEATRPAVGVTVGVLVFVWTAATPFLVFLVLKGTFGPVFRWLGPPTG